MHCSVSCSENLHDLTNSLFSKLALYSPVIFCQKKELDSFLSELNNNWQQLISLNTKLAVVKFILWH